jgi:CHAT domain-containing protein
VKSPFDRRLSKVAEQLGLHALPELPAHITRIAVVAGGELAEIPFALLPCPGEGDTLIGRRYALSDLPCLSVRYPLHQRSRGQRRMRGARTLLVQGLNKHGERLTPAAEVPGRKVVTTPVALRTELAEGGYHQVRIDSHGEFDTDQSRPPAIQLAPEGPAGQLSPDEFQSMNLSETSTLVLGACETGMVTRIGRDERTGFVRAALLAGASAVLAARWEAIDPVAARVLDSFELNLRRYPRDVTLFLAQRVEDTRDRSGDPPAAYPATEAHQARWAPWTLYGDTGYQTWRRPVWRSSARAIRRARHLGSSDA